MEEKAMPRKEYKGTKKGDSLLPKKQGGKGGGDQKGEQAPTSRNRLCQSRKARVKEKYQMD